MENTRQQWVGKSFWVMGHKVTPLDTADSFSMVEVVSPARADGPPPHHHDGFSEFFYIVEGRLEVIADGVTTMLKRGQSLTLPSDTVHTFRNPDDAPMTFITGYSPAGFEKFFVDNGIPADEADGCTRSTTPEAMRAVGGTAGRYGMIIAAE